MGLQRNDWVVDWSFREYGINGRRDGTDSWSMFLIRREMVTRSCSDLLCEHYGYGNIHMSFDCILYSRFELDQVK